MRVWQRVLKLALVLAVVAEGARGDEVAPELPIEGAVDRAIDAVLARESVEPATRADDATLLRRLTLDLVGRVPTAAEAAAYVASNDPEKLAQRVDRLMASPGFVRHQVAEFDALLAPPTTKGKGGGGSGLRDYLAHAFGEGRGWDRVFRDLMLPDETAPAEKSAAEFLRRRLKDADTLATDVSALFFGVNISCARCHDHPLVTDWKQDHYYGLKAFLSRTFDNGEFLGERGYGVVKFKTVEGLEKSARMMFLTGRRVEPESAGPDEPSKDEMKAEKAALAEAKKQKVPPPRPRFSARETLVTLALAPEGRDFFARSLVNRVWNRLFGRGLVMPLDQMHSANPASHPELLDWLARDTIAHGYDLRRLIRGLVLSRAYARASVWEQPGEPPSASLFAVAAVRPLTPAQLAVSLRVAVADPATLPADLDAATLETRLSALESSARDLVGDLPTRSGEGSIGVAESLYFSNSGPVARNLLADGPDRLIGRLKQTEPTASRVELAVRNILSRPPDADELPTLCDYLDRRTDRPDDAIRQLVWALLTSSEFRFNH